MSTMIDVLGAMVIGSMLILAMFTFQYQLTDTANSVIYMEGMVEHMQVAYKQINSLISLAGIGILPANTVVVADSNRMEFRTKWNYQTKSIGFTDNRLELSLSNVQTQLGKALTVRQNGTLMNDLGYIFWVDNLRIKYYDIDGHVTTTPANVRSAELWLTFRHNAPSQGGQTLHTKIQMRCYLMNTYLAEGSISH